MQASAYFAAAFAVLLLSTLPAAAQHDNGASNVNDGLTAAASGEAENTATGVRENVTPEDASEHPRSAQTGDIVGQEAPAGVAPTESASEANDVSIAETTDGVAEAAPSSPADPQNDQTTQAEELPSQNADATESPVSDTNSDNDRPTNTATSSQQAVPQEPEVIAETDTGPVNESDSSASETPDVTHNTEDTAATDASGATAESADTPTNDEAPVESVESTETAPDAPLESADTVDAVTASDAPDAPTVEAATIAEPVPTAEQQPEGNASTTITKTVPAESDATGAETGVVVEVEDKPTDATKEKASTEVAPEEPSAEPTEVVVVKPEPEPEPLPNAIRLMTWSGAYGEAQKIALFEPFRARSEAELTIQSHDGQDSLDPMAFDVADMSRMSAEQACKAGTLMKVDADWLSGSGHGDARSDFLDGALGECAVASMAWSSLFAFDTRQFKSKRPSTLTDVFDTDAFPGKRALPTAPERLMEAALLADQVAPEDVYRLLSTYAGVERALNKFRSLGDQVTWWERPHEALSQLAAGKVAMAFGYSGRMFYAKLQLGERLGLIWDGQMIDADVWTISANAQNPALAKEFVSFATLPERMSAQAELFPYGPMRRSAVASTTVHKVTGVSLDGLLPTSPQNLLNALQYDGNWWERKGALARTEFEAFLKGAQSDAEAPAE